MSKKSDQKTRFDYRCGRTDDGRFYQRIGKKQRHSKYHYSRYKLQ